METFTPDKLLASDYPAVTDVRTVLTGQNLKRGTVLAEDSGNSDKLVPVNSGSATASIQDPVCILAEDVDASDADVNGLVYLSGAFNEGALTFGGTDTADTHRKALRDLNIYLKKAVSA
jgi:hypothetical protein